MSIHNVPRSHTLQEHPNGRQEDRHDYTDEMGHGRRTLPSERNRYRPRPQPFSACARSGRRAGQVVLTRESPVARALCRQLWSITCTGALGGAVLTRAVSMQRCDPSSPMKHGYGTPARTMRGRTQESPGKTRASSHGAKSANKRHRPAFVGDTGWAGKLRALHVEVCRTLCLPQVSHVR